MKKLNKILLIGGMVMAMAFGLSRCNGRKDRIAEYAEEKLYYRYGKQFEVKKVYKKANDYFLAYVSPVDNDEIIFEVFYKYDKKNLELSKYEHDDYVQGVISYQLTKEIAPEIQEIFKESDVYVNATLSEENQNKISENITIDEYLKKVSKVSFTVIILVDKEMLKNNDVEKEYDGLARILTKYTRNDEESVGFDIHLTTEQQREEVKKQYELIPDYYVALKRTGIDIYKSILSGTYDNELKITKEEYCEKREGIL